MQRAMVQTVEVRRVRVMGPRVSVGRVRVHRVRGGGSGFKGFTTSSTISAREVEL